jgi:hypothetical protein
MPVTMTAPIGAALLASLLGCTASQPANTTERAKGGSTAQLTWEQVAQRALKPLSDQERRGAAVYLDERELPPGSTLKVDQKEIPVPRTSAVAFVDQDPQANWGHACRYLLIDLESGNMQSIDAQFPPFLRGVPQTLRLIWKGEAVPEWAIAKP